MAKGSYATKQILNWMEYFSKEMQVSPEKKFDLLRTYLHLF